MAYQKSFIIFLSPEQEVNRLTTFLIFIDELIQKAVSQIINLSYIGQINNLSCIPGYMQFLKTDKQLSSLGIHPVF